LTTAPPARKFCRLRASCGREALCVRLIGGEHRSGDRLGYRRRAPPGQTGD
jgi:hypothetical protein